MATNRMVKLALIQPKLLEGDPQTSLERASAQIEVAARQGAQLVCLPELYNTGYFLSPGQFIELAEPQDGPYIRALQRLASKEKVYIVTGYAESCGISGRIYNSAALIGCDGALIGNMRKINLWGEEKLKFRTGDTYPVFDTPLGKIGLMVCYDIEFPESARVLALKGAELIIAPAMWDKPAAKRWDLALAANALFNVLYVAGCNPVGEIACGASQVRAPGGELVASASPDKEELLLCEIDLADVQRMRAELPYFNDLRPDLFPDEIVCRY